MRANARGSTLQFGRTVSGYLVRVEGRGTLRESPAVFELADRLLTQELQTSTFVIDLTDCDYLDSTFLGCLAMLHRRYNRADPHRFLIVAPPEQCQKLLAPSRLNRFLEVTARCPDLVLESLETLGTELPAHDLGRHVMECHRRLAELGGPNQAAYQSIADRLAQELGVEDSAIDPPTQEHLVCPRPPERSQQGG
jgi:anti-anti-sigma factor